MNFLLKKELPIDSITNQKMYPPSVIERSGHLYLAPGTMLINSFGSGNQWTFRIKNFEGEKLLTCYGSVNPTKFGSVAS